MPETLNEVLLNGGDGGGPMRSLDSLSMSGVDWRKEGGGMNGGLSKRSGLCGETGLCTGKSEAGEES